MVLPMASEAYKKRQAAMHTSRRYKVPHLWAQRNAEHTVHILRRADRSPLLALFFDGKRVVNARMSLFNGDQDATLKWLQAQGQKLLDGEVTKEEIDANKPGGNLKVGKKNVIVKKTGGVESEADGEGESETKRQARW